MHEYTVTCLDYSYTKSNDALTSAHTFTAKNDAEACQKAFEVISKDEIPEAIWDDKKNVIHSFEDEPSIYADEA